MVKENIKVLTQLINKPVKDFDENDIDKIIESDRRELLLNIDVVEYLIDNCNDSVVEVLNPIYIQLSFKETMTEIEKLLKAYYTNPVENADELKTQMLSYLESDGLVEFLAATRIIQCVFADSIDLKQYKDNISDSLTQLENIIVTIPMPNGKELIQQLLSYLYYPIIVDWYVANDELLVNENEAFKYKLNEYSEFIAQRQQEEIEGYLKENGGAVNE